MSEFQVHSIPGSPYGRSVFATLEEKGASYRLVPVAPGTLRTPSHLARHPFGKIPVVEHNGFVLYECQAILRYLDRVLPGPSLTPPTPRDAARMDQLLNITDWYLFQGVSNVIGFQRIVGPRVFGITPDEAVIAAAMPRALAVFHELAMLLGGKSFFVGDALSLADIMLAAQIDFFREIPEWERLTADAPHLRDWLDRMNARPCMRATTWERVAALAQAA